MIFTQNYVTKSDPMILCLAVIHSCLLVYNIPFFLLYPNLLIDSSFDEYLGFQCFVNKCSAAVNIW